MTLEKALMTLLMPIVLLIAPGSSVGAETRFRLIDTAELHSMVVDNAYRLEAGRERQFTVIDARSKEEYDKAHIFGAISVPERDFEKSAAILPKDKGALLTVYGDDAKSDTGIRWANRAAAAGYSNIAVYPEGFAVWKKRQMPIAPFPVRKGEQK